MRLGAPRCGVPREIEPCAATFELAMDLIKLEMGREKLALV